MHFCNMLPISILSCPGISRVAQAYPMEKMLEHLDTDMIRRVVDGTDMLLSILVSLCIPVL